MNAHRAFGGSEILLASVLALTLVGCQSSKDSDSSPTGPAGSISDINRKMGGRSGASEGQPPPPQNPEIVLLVVHDAEGKPQYIEVQRSSGDPATDRRAQDYVLRERRFPKGAANTVTVTVDPKRLPKP